MYVVINLQELMTNGKVSLNNSRWNQAEGTALDYYIKVGWFTQKILLKKKVLEECSINAFML